MTRPVDMVNDAAVSAVGIVLMRNSYGQAINKVPTKGHHHFTLTSKQDAADSATVVLKGTNNPDPADTTGETLATNAHAAAGQLDASAASKGYKYVFVQLTAEGAGAGASFAAAGGIRLHGTGEGTVG